MVYVIFFMILCAFVPFAHVGYILYSEYCAQKESEKLWQK